jgi:KDO2-lipid IV(A) lauroyltransferase
MTRIAILAVRLIGLLPLSTARLFGRVLGNLLWLVAGARRSIVGANLSACFPELGARERARLTRAVFVRFAQSWVDRGWLWHGQPDLLRRRLKLVGRPQDLLGLQGRQPTVIFAPHFVGLDAGSIALAIHLQRPIVALYTRQSNPVADRWVTQGRVRIGDVSLYQREDGPKPLIASLREGALLYLLPDMDFGLRDSIFVPFFGVPAATVPSLSRFARLGRARVVPLLARMTASGYEFQVLEAWSDFPSGDAHADTARMNRCLEGYVRDRPEEYYWLHRRFKSRPAGAPPIY